MTKLFHIHQSAIRAAQLEADPEAETLRRIRLHDVRHTYATLGLLEGIHRKIISERLGHANVMITLDNYSHVVQGMQQSAAELLEASIDAD